MVVQRMWKEVAAMETRVRAKKKRKKILKYPRVYATPISATLPLCNEVHQ
jgi:hypothetical protein